MTLPAFSDDCAIPVLPDEVERLEALRNCGILDTPEDESFSRLTRLGAMLTGAAICTVTFVDEFRQWFKSPVGLGDITETPRSVSFCTHAIEGDKLFVVPDTTLDRRFSRNPLVTGSPNIRFYAGAPLMSASGHRLGTFCIIDIAPRDGLTEQERRILVDFAALTTELVESRIDQRERRAAEQLLVRKALQSEQQTLLFQQTLDTITQGLSVFGADFRLVMANNAFAQLYGKPPELSKHGSHLSDHLRFHLNTMNFEGDVEKEIQRLEALALEPEGSLTYTKTPAGRTLEIRTHLLDNGCFVTTHTDITESRQTEQQLRRQEKMKDEFISTVSHELRTPLTSIAGALGVLSCGGGGALPDKAAKLVAIAESNCDRLTRLVSDVLDIERMALGKFQLNTVPTGIQDLILQSIETLSPYGERYEVAFRFTPPENAIRTVTADPDRVMQVLTNLLSNAAKFSPPGTVVTVSLAGSAEGVRVEVADRGPGIPDEFRSRIFEKFAQADHSDSRKGGTGLGLNIAKMIVEAHGGRIGFESALGEGSNFWFELPPDAA